MQNTKITTRSNTQDWHQTSSSHIGWQPIRFNVRTHVRDPALASFLERCPGVGCIYDHVVVSCLAILLFIWNAIDELKPYRTFVVLVSYIGTSAFSRDLRAFIFEILLKPWEIPKSKDSHFPGFLCLVNCNRTPDRPCPFSQNLNGHQGENSQDHSTETQR